MPLPPPRYTPDQRAAVRHCARLLNWTPKKVVAAAARGELPAPFHELEPFDVVYSTVQSWFRDERKRMRREQGRPIDALLSEAAAILDEDLRRVKRLRAGEKRATAVTTVLKGIREWVATDRAANPPAPAGKDNAKPEPTKREKSTADRLNRAAKSKPEHHDPTPNRHQDSDSSAAPTATHGLLPVGQHSDPVSS